LRDKPGDEKRKPSDFTVFSGLPFRTRFSQLGTLSIRKAQSATHLQEGQPASCLLITLWAITLYQRCVCLPLGISLD